MEKTKLGGGVSAWEGGCPSNLSEAETTLKPSAVEGGGEGKEAWIGDFKRQDEKSVLVGA